MSDTAGGEAKVRERPPSEILADIERERAELSSSFEALRGELDEALDAGRQRVRQAGRKAAAIGPLVAAVMVSVAGTALVLRRRFRTRT